MLQRIYQFIFAIWLPVSDLNIKLCSNYVQNDSSALENSHFGGADGDLCYDDAVFSTYTYMHGQMEGTGLHTHHLIEKRLLPALQEAFPTANLTEGKIISTPLNPQVHQVYTNAWRAELPYGDSGSYNIEQVVLAVQKVYANDPVMLKATNDWLISLGATIP